MTSQKFNEFYEKLLSFVPEDYRIVVSVLLIILVLYLIYHFLKKQLIWIIVGLLLIPFVFPAARSIYLTVWEAIQKFFGK